ncbi:MAG: ABC transporter substrate-binding protein [Chloroflexota bacterium]
MRKNVLWLVVSGLMALSLLMAACGPAATPAAPTIPTVPTAPSTPTTPTSPTTTTTPVEKEAVKSTAEAPKYGGTLRLVGSGDPRFDTLFKSTGDAMAIDLVLQGLWAGAWSKGNAGGYGTKETDWVDNSDRFDQKIGLLAESTKWTADAAKNQGTIVYKVRQGVRWALNPASEISRQVNGRELTADDVAFQLKKVITNPISYIYLGNPELRTANVTKTGTWEVTVANLSLDGLVSAVSRFGDSMQLETPEVEARYGNTRNWLTSVGTGPFIISEYVASSQLILKKNPNYWMKDPIGPGKGNQLPYLDSVRFLIIPDVSTRQAALRTGKIDQMSGFAWEDAAQMRKTVPALLELQTPGGSSATKIRLVGPLADVRVRRAMMMTIDYKTIFQNVYGGFGQIHTFPWGLVKGYEGLYLSLDDPLATESVKELFVYNPEKAKQLLKEAGYPNGFKTSIVITVEDVDYYSIIKDMWAKVGIELKLDVKDTGAKNTIIQTGNFEGMTTTGGNPVAVFYMLVGLVGESNANPGRINDPIINEGMSKVRAAMVTKGEAEAMRMTKELTPYIIDQVYSFPRPYGLAATFWWPWLRSYSGEVTIGYFDKSWPQYIRYDDALKKSMGY